MLTGVSGTTVKVILRGEHNKIQLVGENFERLRDTKWHPVRQKSYDFVYIQHLNTKNYRILLRGLRTIRDAWPGCIKQKALDSLIKLESAILRAEKEKIESMEKILQYLENQKRRKQ